MQLETAWRTSLMAARPRLYPSADHAADFVDVTGPDLQPLRGDVAQPPRFAHQVPQHLDLDIEIEKRRRLLPPLPRNGTKTPDSHERRTHLRREHVALDLGPLVHDLVRVGVQFLDFL